MPENDNNPARPFTHTAWVFKNEGVRRNRRHGRWIAQGVGRVEPDGNTWVYLDSLPIGGFDGRVCLTKNGDPPPQPEQPRRPDGDDGEAED
jgi:hypothetical protein